MTDTPRPDLSGQTLAGLYHLLEREEATVLADHYKARDGEGELVMVKVLHPALTSRPEIVGRFETEARAAAELDHPNLCATRDFGAAEDGRSFLVLQYATGPNLRDLLQGEGRLPWARAVHIVKQACDGLEAAHARDIVHRKVRPEKMLVLDDGAYPDFVKVLEVGVANVRFADLHLEPQAANGPAVHHAAAYMAPEQAEGRRFEPGSDVYALGVVLFEMLAGRLPFIDDDPYRLLRLHVTTEVPYLDMVAPEARVPSGIEAVMRRALSKRPDDRFESAGELGTALTAAG